MTAPGEEILAWTDAAISTAERTAREAAEAAEGDSWEEYNQAVYASGPGGGALAEGVLYGDLFESVKLPVVRHMALNDPKQVLLRVAADRKTFDRHTRHRTVRDTTLMSFGCHHSAEHDSRCAFDQQCWPCPDFLSLAEGYGWTGGDR